MKKLSTVAILLLVSKFALANDSQFLIQEMEGLRNSLSIDDPKKVELTLRLADLYFDVSIQEGKAEQLDDLKKNRLKALELYKHSLNGTEQTNKAEGLTRIKIQFQMARLLSRLSEGKMAEPYYLEVLAHDATPKAMKEQAALALGEWYEEEVQMSKAEKFFTQAISLCTDLNSCNYGYYRLGWLYYKDAKLDQAISAMEKSLWTKEGLIRENSLTDYILFLSNKETDGAKELEGIQKIALKAQRPELSKLLVEAFYVAGNRYAGSNLLAELNKNDPNIYYEVRLLEEFYGFRKWDRVNQFLSIMEQRSIKDLPKKPEEAKEVLTILRRFIVQVDAEMQVAKDLNVTLKRSIDIYLQLYPRDELRSKMQAGWLSAESNVENKITKLGLWIKEDAQFGVSSDELRKLRQTRLSLAQNLKMHDIVVEESLAIASILGGSEEADEFNYVAARELYSKNKLVESLPLFQKVVERNIANQTLNKFTILSQNIILDIFNTQKNYDAIIAQVELWSPYATKMASHSSLTDELKKDLAKEDLSMKNILIQSKFEKAVAQKDSQVALDSFYQFCLSDIYPDKSCVNAKILSVKFKDQPKLIGVLEKTNDQNSLMVEYELMGRFSDAAKIRENLLLNGVNFSIEDAVKTALLFELDADNVSRDRVLNKVIEKVKKEKKVSNDNEKLLFLTLDDAGLINEKILTLPWSTSIKLKIASKLATKVSTNVGSLEARKILLSEKESHGPVWSKTVLADLESDYQKTNAIKFYGTRSQVLFKQRTNAIEKFSTKAKALLDGADLETRVYVLQMLKMTYKNMANEILNTPIPEGLDEETLTNVTTQISTMADPFDRVNEDYDRLLTEQLAMISDEGLRLSISNNLKSETLTFSQFIKIPNVETVVGNFDPSVIKGYRAALQSNPEDMAALNGLRDYFKSINNQRLTAYFSGRLESLK